MNKITLLPLAALALPFAPALAEDESPSGEFLPKPEAIVADQIPPIPTELARELVPYREGRSAAFRGWDPKDGSMIISTRFANTSQLHRVKVAGGARAQLTFEDEPVSTAVFTENGGEVLLTSKDEGGAEFYQIYRIENGRLVRLTNGKGRSFINATSPDGKLVAFSSTQRNGRDYDLYVMDPRDPSTTRMVLERDDYRASISDIAQDERTAILRERTSVELSSLSLLDLETGEVTPLTDPAESAVFSSANFDVHGRIWAISDTESDFQRLGTIDRETGDFEVVVDEAWDVGSYDFAPDGSFIVYRVNAPGGSRLKLLDLESGEVRQVDLPPGIVSGIEVAPSGTIGFTYSSNRSPADAYSLDPTTLEVTRWTFSETAGLDPSQNALPELIEVNSFDGEPMSGLLYRPDPEKFPGPRPLFVSIHGGPEAQTTASAKGSYNYYVNELGVAMLFPNVRGSTGFGKRFVSLENGPFLREDSVKDIGAFLDALQADPQIDSDRMAVRGGSYGGYMCYASAIAYGDRFKAASCVIAISDFVTFLENTQDYRRDRRRQEYGDERDPMQRTKLKEISPLTRADEIRIPLMVSTGANDPRVPASEADQIIEIVRANGIEASHFLALNEGHGFRKKENADYYVLAQIMFVKRHLLGK